MILNLLLIYFDTILGGLGWVERRNSDNRANSAQVKPNLSNRAALDNESLEIKKEMIYLENTLYLNLHSIHYIS